MRYKIVPEPRQLDSLLAARDALPLVPSSVEDCCTRIRDRTTVQSRDAARELITFMQALGMAAETDRGFHRIRGEVTPEDLQTPFTENVFGAREILDAVVTASEPLDPEDAFAAIRDDIPQWERAQYTNWEQEWVDRVERLLEWAAVFGLVASEDGGYTAETDTTLTDQ